MAVVIVAMIASYGELNFNAFGFFVQIVAVVVEACRIISVQLVLGKANLKLNSITTLYYVSPICFVFLIVPFAFLELPKLAYGLEITHSIHYSAGVMIANASRFRTERHHLFAHREIQRVDAKHLRRTQRHHFDRH